MRKLCAISILLSAAAFAARPDTTTHPLRVLPDAEALENYDLVSLTRIYFSVGSDHWASTVNGTLDQLVRDLSASPQSIIELRGYADGGKSAPANAALSLKRGQQVARFLTDHGIARERILILGLGEIDPAGQSRLAEHQRVDIRTFVRPRVNTASQHVANPSLIQETWGGK